MSERLTPAEIRLAQYGERTSTLSTATYDSGSEKALHEIALGLKAEIDRLRAERHETNEQPHDAIVAQRASDDPKTYAPVLPWAPLMDDEDLHDFLGDLQDAAMAMPWTDATKVLAEVEKTFGTWRVIAEAQHAHNTALGPEPVGAGDPS